MALLHKVIGSASAVILATQLAAFLLKGAGRVVVDENLLWMVD